MKTDASRPSVHRPSHRSRHRRNQLGRRAGQRLQEHLRLEIFCRRCLLVSREFGRINAANSRLRESSPHQHAKTLPLSILTPKQGLGPFGILGRPNFLLRRLLVLRHLRRIRHRAHRALARPLHLLLAHQRLRNFHLAAALEPRHHGHSHRPRNPVPRR